MTRPWLGRATMISAVLLVAGAVVAKQGVVVTKEGRKFEGDVIEKENQIIVTIHGVETTLPREDSMTITYTEDFATDFDARLAKLDVTDVAGRIVLARVAFDRRQYAKSREALDSALAIDPNNKEATDLLNLITVQMRLEQTKTSSDPRPVSTLPPNPMGVDRRFLTASDINVIRQKELQPTDRVSVRFENNVEKRFMKYRNIQFNDFNVLKPVDKALRILKEGEDSMKPDVRILADPAAISEYRRTIQPYILNGCAASNCHGNSKSGDFVLYSPGDTEQPSYTNLYILSRYHKDTGEASSSSVFSSRDHKIIDRGHGAQSLLAQYGLPTDVAELDHPRVEGYTGIFRNMDDVRFKQLVTWMNQSLVQPEPDYGIKFEPLKASATQPSTRPVR